MYADRQRGLSLVELMVGMVVALLVSLAATNSALSFMASQRQAGAAGGVTINAATGLSAIKSDIASAGLGFFSNSTFACWKLSFSTELVKRFDADNFAPAKITRSGNNDELEVMYGSEVDGGATLYLEGSSDGSSAMLRSLMPVAVGQAAVLMPNPTKNLGKTCLIRTVTANTPSTATSRQVVGFANTGAYNKVAFTVPPTFADQDQVALLGTLRWMRYYLDGTNLTAQDRLGGSTGVLMRNVLSFRVQYGISADGTSTTLTGWQDAVGSTWGTITGDTVDRVRALRLGVLLRSAQPEKPNPKTGECEASAAKPRDPLDSSTEVTPDVGNWKCYRYRSAVVVVPLRNMVW